MCAAVRAAPHRRGGRAARRGARACREATLRERGGAAEGRPSARRRKGSKRGVVSKERDRETRVACCGEREWETSVEW